MRGFGNVTENFFQAPPPGTYPVTVIACEAGISKAGNTQLIVDLEIVDGPFKGEQFRDWVGTDPSAKGAGLSRSKLRPLLEGTPFRGLADAAESNEVADTQLAQALIGQRLYCTIANSPRKLKDQNTGQMTDQIMTAQDPKTGALVTIMNADVKGYTRHAVSQQVAQGQPSQTIAPVQATQSFTPAPVQGGYVPQATAVPVQGAPTLPFQPNFQPGVASPPWQAQANGATGAEAPKKGKRVAVQDVQG